MNADLDDTLAGLGADARRMVSAMKGAFPEERRAGGERHGGRGVLPWFAAASGLAGQEVRASLSELSDTPAQAKRSIEELRGFKEVTFV